MQSLPPSKLKADLSGVLDEQKMLGWSRFLVQRTIELRDHGFPVVPMLYVFRKILKEDKPILTLPGAGIALGHPIDLDLAEEAVQEEGVVGFCVIQLGQMVKKWSELPKKELTEKMAFVPSAVVESAPRQPRKRKFFILGLFTSKTVTRSFVADVYEDDTIGKMREGAGAVAGPLVELGNLRQWN